MSATLREETTKPTYALVLTPGAIGIRCLRCERVSFNFNDVARLYCSSCKVWHSEELVVLMAMRAFTLGLRAARLGPKMPEHISVESVDAMDELDALMTELERHPGGSR